MGQVQCIRCRAILEDCRCSIRIANPVQRKVEPHRSMALPPGALDSAAQERLLQAIEDAAFALEEED